MNRNHITNGAVLIAIVVMFIIAWYIVPGAFWGGVLAIPLTLMIIKTMEKYQDERFTQILQISMRNGFIFLLIALPWTGAMWALDVLILDTLPAIILILWVTSMAVTYGSGIFYFRK